jgi:hypothetical protein
MSDKIKVGYCVAYDWELLRHSIPTVYDHADLICLSLDKNRISWSGSSYTFDQSAFNRFIDEIDPKKKIRIYEDDFSRTELTPMENEVRQRNMIAAFMGKGGWHIQLDTDEYFLDFKNFTHYLKNFSPKVKTNVCCPWLTLFKKTDTGFLIIDQGDHEELSFIPVATKDPEYSYGRNNGHFNHLTDFFIIHQSWAREKDEVLEKINNWGHKNDFDTATYFQNWEKLNIENYKQWKDFHPIQPALWKKLLFVSGNSIEELIRNAGSILPELPANYIRKKNSLFLSRMNKLAKKLKLR